MRIFHLRSKKCALQQFQGMPFSQQLMGKQQNPIGIETFVGILQMPNIPAPLKLASGNCRA